MRVILEVNPDKYSKISQLVEERRYESVAQFVDMALENQLHLESVSPIESGASLDYGFEKDFDIPSKIREQSGFSIEAGGTAPVAYVDEPDPKVLEFDYLWMMNNRFLPVKSAIRSLLSCLADGSSIKQWADLSTVQDAAIKAAVRIGKLLETSDKQRNNGDKLAISFPSSRNEKSQSRFAWYCVGNLKSNNIITGAPAALRFVNIVKNENKRAVIGLTQAGLAFARLKNPVLDLGDTSTPLSREETEYLWLHITRVLPKEHSLMLRVLDYIGQGQNTPNALTEPVKSILNKNLTETISQRASLVSRLAEMGLVVRRKHGLHLTYELTDRGQEVLTSERPRVPAAR